MLRSRSRSGSRGLSLVESLVALAVSSAGLLALVGHQSALRHGTEAARQRGEALRLAQGALEATRSFVSVPASAGTGLGAATWDALTSGPAQAAADLGAHSDYQRRQTVSNATTPTLKQVAVQLGWPGAPGQGAQQLTLVTLVAAADPALSGRLLLSPPTTTSARALGRHAGVPLSATDLGNGRSAFMPLPGHPQAWVLDNASGRITGVCSVATVAPQLSAEALAACSNNTSAQLLSGYVRFDDGDGSTLSGRALNLDLTLDVSGTTCVDDAPINAGVQTLVRYHCLVPTAAGAAWSGRSRVLPLAFAGDNASAWSVVGAGSPAANARRLCRYGSGASNADHPATYLDVTTPLMHQNFLVLPAAQACPAGTVAQDG